MLEVRRTLTPQQENDLRQTSGYPDRVDFRVVDNSRTELEAAHARASAEFVSPQSRQWKINLVSLELKKNRVVLGTSDMSEENRRAIVAYYPETLYEVRQELEPQAHDTTVDSPGQLKSGLEVWRPTETPGIYHRCTSAFGVRDNATGRYGILTAGHCFGATNEVWSHGFPAGTTGSFGRSIRQSYNFMSSADAGYVQHEWAGHRSNLQYKGNYVNGSRQIAFRQTESEDFEGQTVCMSGAGSDWYNCGSVTSTSSTLPIDGIVHQELRQASYYSVRGDSGAGVFNGAFAYGIHNANHPISGNSIYSHVHNAEQELGVSVLTALQAIELQAVHSEQCLDLHDSSTAAVQLEQWSCQSSVNQKWKLAPIVDTEFFEIRSMHDQCADVEAGSQSNGARVLQWPCHGDIGTNQHFDLISTGSTWGAFSMAPRHTIPGYPGAGSTPKCVDVWNFAIAPPAVGIQQWDCNSGNNQRWLPR